MSPNLEKQLIKKYPKLFRDINGNPQKTLMIFGISVDDGWYNLLDCLCYSISKYAERNTKVDPYFCQIKEKFSCLRIYLDGGDDYIDNIISFSESLSARICEKCGCFDSTVKQRNDGWIKTLCDKCVKK